MENNMYPSVLLYRCSLLALLVDVDTAKKDMFCMTNNDDVKRCMISASPELREVLMGPKEGF